MKGSNLKSVISNIEKYKEKLRKNINKAITTEVKVLIKEGFKDQKDPYGNSWDLDKTGTVFDPKHTIEKAFKVETTDTGVLITNTLDYAIYHQTGTETLPQRMMVPDSDKGLGDWGENIIREATNAAHGIKLTTLKEEN